MGPCLSLVQMERLLEEQLDRAEREIVVEHVEACPVCQERLGGIVATKHMVPAHLAAETENAVRPSSSVVEFLEELKGQGPPGELFRYWPNGRIGDVATLDALPDPELASVSRPLPVIAGFQVVREIGRGGMGVVYEATELALGRRVALKVLPAQALVDPRQVRRFEREAQSAAKLHHTNIVPVFGVGEHDGTHFYVMQFIPGRGLDSILEMLKNSQRARPAESTAGGEFDAGGRLFVRSGVAYGRSKDPGLSDSDVRIGVPSIGTSALSESDRQFIRNVARIGVQVAEALAYAHAQGILHRDIKPSNLLLDENGTVWVADFGLAKMVGTDDATHSAFIVGTLRYMAPERFSGKGDAGADIYALGMTLYELLAMRPAFEENDRTSLIRLVTQEDPPRLRKLNRKVPRDLETIVHTAIAREPARRYATAAALAEDLQRFLDGRPSRARRVGATERAWRWCRRNPIVALLTATVFVLLAAVTAISSVAYVQTKLALTGEARQRETAEALEAKANEEADRAKTAEQEMRRQWYAASINLMQQAWDTNQLSRLRALLTDTEKYPGRGFEWYYWQRLCHLDWRTLVGHRAEIRSISWSPDGKLLATGSMDGTAKIWDASTGAEKFALKGHMSQVTCVSWSPNGSLLATASWDGTAKVWNSRDGSERVTLEGHTNRVWSVAWSPDGRSLATGSHTGTIRIWDLDTGRASVLVKGQNSPVNSVAWSPDSRLLALAGADASVKILQTADGREALTLRGHTGPVSSVSWSAGSRLLATGGLDGTARVWSIAEGRTIVTLDGHTAGVSCVLWSPDGKCLATASADGTAKVWDAGDGRVRLTLRGHTNKVSSVTWSPNGNLLATASADGTAKLWEADDSRELLTLRLHNGPVNSVDWSPDGRCLATGGTDGTAKVVDAVDGHEISHFKDHPSPINSVAWSADGKLLAMAGADGAMKVWDPADGRGRIAIKAHPSPVNSVAWSPDGRLLATSSWDGIAKVWEAVGGREQLRLEGQTGGVRSVSWSPDGRRLATGSADGTAKVWYARTAHEQATLKGHLGEVSCASWSPDGRLLATASWDGTAKTWDASSGQETRTFKGHTALVWSVSWSPGGRRLATGSEDGTVKVWDVSSGHELLTLKRHTGAIRSVAWSPDGNRLAMAGDDSTVKVCEAASAAAVRDWARNDRAIRELLARNAFQGASARGFIQQWLLLLALASAPRDIGEQALDKEQIPDEALLCPRAGDRATTASGQQLVWREHQSPNAVLDFNAALGRVAERCVAYAVCYLETDQPRDDFWLQVTSDDQSKVYVNGRQVYRCHLRRPMLALDTVGPVSLNRGTNVLVFKVVNEGANWAGCVRLVNDAGIPVKDVQIKLVP